MITSVQPLNIWMYRECYLRFSTQIFNLENFHESLHLTNHAVQCKYSNYTQRDKSLPQQNMWDCHIFKNYLKDIGKPTVWDDLIYPGLRENIIGTMLACQDTMDRRANTFELYGADFILGEDFKPWLLEINSCPDLSPSTNVTRRMCPQCLQDIIKVMVDNRRNPSSDTGLFQLVFKQNLPKPPMYLGMSLLVRGRKLFKTKKVKSKDLIKEKFTLIQDIQEMSIKQFPKSCQLSDYKGPIIEDFIEEMQQSIYPPQIQSDGYEFIPAPPSTSGKKKQSCKNDRVPKKEFNSIKHSSNKLNFVNRNQNVKENVKIMEVGYKKFRSMFIKSAYFGLLHDCKIKNKYAITPEDKIDLCQDNAYKQNTNILKHNSILTKCATQNLNKNETLINKKCKEPQQRLPCVNVKLSFPPLHKIEPKLNLRNSPSEMKKM